MDSSLQWPAQALLNLVAIKGKEGGGDRPITLTASIYRVWSRLRKCHVQDFDQKKAGHWDAAIRGSSALRTTIMRELLNEGAVKNNMFVTQLGWDLAKFYDHIDPAKVAEKGLQLGYSAKIMYLGLLVHKAARVLVQDQACSLPRLPDKSVIAGCFQSVSWSRIYLYEVLDAAHKVSPLGTLSSWVDDVPMTVRSWTMATAERITVKMAKIFVDKVQLMGGKISEKSGLLASHKELGMAVKKALGRHGIHLELKESMRDLGGDASLGKHRRIGIFKARQMKAHIRAYRVRALTKVTPKARTIVWQALKAQLSWGQAMKGVSPTTIKANKALLVKATHCRQAGGCTTTALGIIGQGKKDPAYVYRQELLSTWLELANVLNPTQHQMIAAAWQKEAGKLKEPKTRWNRTTGPLTAIISTVWEIGWKPIKPLIWEDKEGQAWRLEPGRPGAKKELAAVLEESIQGLVWKGPAKHHLGKGLEAGVDWTVVEQHRAHLKKKGKYEALVILEGILQGAVWDPQRRTQASRGKGKTSACPWCNLEQADLEHMVWRCEAHKQSTDKDIISTNPLCIASVEGCQRYPCFWLRGLVPGSWVKEKLAKYEDIDSEETKELGWEHLEEGGSDPQQWPKLPEHSMIGTDGSARHGNKPRLRRAGWGYIILDKEGAPIAGRWGPLPGSTQTVPRAELWAMVQATATHGDTKIYSDSAYVVGGWMKGRKWKHKENGDLWLQLWDHLGARQGQARVVKVKAHATKDQLRVGVVDTLPYIANSAADWAARQGRDMWGKGVAQSTVEGNIKELDIMAWRIQRRLLAVITKYYKDCPAEKKEKARKDTNPRKAREERTRRLLGILLLQGHQVHIKGGKVHCLKCKKGTKLRRPRPWCKGQCTSTREQGIIHKSHRLHNHKGLCICTVCGSFVATGKPRKLTAQCKAPSSTGRNALRAVSKDKLPFGVKAWPSP